MEMMFDISQDELPLFLAEVDEHLQVLDESLVQLERTESDPEILQSLFRAAHTLKGMAGMIGHQRMTRLTHALETAFDGLRKNNTALSTSLVDLCLASVDGLRLLREEVVSNTQSDFEVEELILRFQQVTMAGGSGQPVHTASFASSKTPDRVKTSPQVAPKEADVPGMRRVGVKAVIDSHSVATAARAFQLMMVLQELGEIISMSPSQAIIETAAPVAEFTAEIKTNHCDEEILKALNIISDIPQILLNDQTPAQKEVEKVPAKPVEKQPENLKVEKAPARPVGAVDDRNKIAARQSDMTVRTTVERLDTLMNLVGELITDRNHLYQIRNRFQKDGHDKNDQLSETVSHLGRITDQLQEEVMSIRMLPMGNVFNKFPRMVRDMAQKTNKQIDLVIHGEETELDRSMTEEINDPLIHLVRNSVDHGIELPEVRRAAGKPERGTITLNARHEQGRIVLTVEDDGGGIDVTKVRKSALAKGLISEEEAASLTDEQCVDLIFLPGLSTAQKVTDISGRGVGMDIVHNNIQRVNGTIQVETHPGQGTVFQIVLPLTLAIVQTLLVEVQQEVYAIPLVMVTGSLRLTKKDIQTVRGKPVTMLRGEILPLVHLSDVFDLPESTSQSKYSFVVVVHSGKQRVGLVVDSLTGEEEVVVKSLGSVVGNIPGISSAAILGDGKVTLIVDIPGLFKFAGIR
jgi:two-component system, chemotaxis family, sensor kinase CheA